MAHATRSAIDRLIRCCRLDCDRLPLTKPALCRGSHLVVADRRRVLGSQLRGDQRSAELPMKGFSGRRDVQRGMHADKMHDAIRADIISGGGFREGTQVPPPPRTPERISPTAAACRQDISTNLEEAVPGGVRANMNKVKAALQIYVATGESVLKALQRDAECSAARIRNIQEKFAFLENANEALSKDLLKWSSEVNSKEQRRASAQRQAMDRSFRLPRAAPLDRHAGLCGRADIRALAQDAAHYARDRPRPRRNRRPLYQPQ